MQLRKSSRKKAKIKLGLAGPSGSGKTYTALKIAHGMCGDWNKIAIIDSENGSADLYSNMGPYNVLSISAPYHPEKYIEAIHLCETSDIDVIIIDSITHEWSGKGGCLDLHEQATAKQKNPNSYTSWAEITPLHQSFVDAILQSPKHIITTVRSKTEYVMTEKNGKQVPTKMGMAAVTRDGFEYELTLSLDLSIDHKAFVSKDRTELFAGKNPFVPSEKTGKTILEWCESGVDEIDEVKAAIIKLQNCSSVDELKMFKATLEPEVIANDEFISAGILRFNQLKTA